MIKSKSISKEEIAIHVVFTKFEDNTENDGYDWATSESKVFQNWDLAQLYIKYKILETMQGLISSDQNYTETRVLSDKQTHRTFEWKQIFIETDDGIIVRNNVTVEQLESYINSDSYYSPNYIPQHYFWTCDELEILNAEDCDEYHFYVQES